MGKISQRSLVLRSLKIAEIISQCPTEQRGDLMKLVAEDLKRRTQVHAGKLLETAASTYNAS